MPGTGAFAKDNESQGIVARIYGEDAVTKKIINIDYEHHEIHDQRHYFVAGSATKDAGGDILFFFTTPDSVDSLRRSHMIINVIGTAQVLFAAYEGSSYDVSSAGSEVVPVNNDFASLNTSVNCLRLDPTIVNTGTLKYEVGAGARNNAGFIERNHEIILELGQSYLFILRSLVNGNIMTYNSEWYEHIHKD